MRYAKLTLALLPWTAFGCSTPPTNYQADATASAATRRWDGINEAQTRRLGGPWYRAADDPGWYFDALVGIESEPDYAGSDDNDVEPDATLQALYRDRNGHRYFVNIGELGAWWLFGKGFTLGTLLEYEEARENENEALEGFEEVDATVEAQVTLAKRFGDFTLAGVLQPELTDAGKGFVTFFGVGWDRMLSSRLRTNVSLDVSFGDAEHMATEFGVSSGDSAGSGLDMYDPGAGLKSSTLGLELEYFFSAHFSVIFGTELEYYFSRAADSPLIADEGTELTHETAVGLRWSF